MDDPEGDKGQEGSTFLSMLNPELRGRLHDTVGIGDAPVPPFEAGALDESFEKGEKGLDKLRLGEDSRVSTAKEVQVVTICFSSSKSSGRATFFQVINHSHILVRDTFRILELHRFVSPCEVPAFQLRFSLHTARGDQKK